MNIWVCNERKNSISSFFHGFYGKNGRSNSFAWQRWQSIRAWILGRVLEVKQVYWLFLMQSLNTPNTIWEKMELVSLIYMENLCFFSSPGTMAWPPLTEVSSASAEILMTDMFVLVKKIYFHFSIKLFKTWLHRSPVESRFPKLLKMSCHFWRSLNIDISFTSAINPFFSPAALWP